MEIIKKLNIPVNIHHRICKWCLSQLRINIEILRIWKKNFISYYYHEKTLTLYWKQKRGESYLKKKKITWFIDLIYLFNLHYLHDQLHDWCSMHSTLFISQLFFMLTVFGKNSWSNVKLLWTIGHQHICEQIYLVYYSCFGIQMDQDGDKSFASVNAARYSIL